MGPGSYGSAHRGTTLTTESSVDVDVLRDEVKKKYAEVATDSTKTFHFHTGRPLANALGYQSDIVDRLPEEVVQSFAGVGNPFSVGVIEPGDTVIDVGSGSGFDCIVAAQAVGESGTVIGVDMTTEMLEQADNNRRLTGLDNVEFRMGYAEELPVEDGRADIAISNGVINLCPDKGRVFKEMFRVLKSGGRLLLSDIITHKPVPQGAKEDIDLWTA